MFKLISVLLLVTIVAVSAEVSNCNCPEEGESSPVCGTDGKTYFNRENLLCHNTCNKSNVKVASEYPCTCVCVNSREFAPVCASDGKTYANPGAVRCHNQCYNENIKILSSLPCHESD